MLYKTVLYLTLCILIGCTTCSVIHERSTNVVMYHESSAVAPVHLLVRDVPNCSSACGNTDKNDCAKTLDVLARIQDQQFCHGDLIGDLRSSCVLAVSGRERNTNYLSLNEFHDLADHIITQCTDQKLGGCILSSKPDTAVCVFSNELRKKGLTCESH